MQISTRNKTILLLGVLMLVLVLTYCQYKIRDSGSAPEGVQEEHALLYDEVSFSRYSPPIVTTFARESSNGLESMLDSLPGETLEDNRWTRLYEQVLGIKIVYDWVAKGEQYQTKLGAVLASGRIPDIVRVNAQQLRQLSNAGVIQDLTEAYETYASDLTKRVHQQEGAGALESAKVNGKLMGIPETDASIERAQFIWLRIDWLETLGLKPPQTMDDLLVISKAFTERDPDQNGEHDTFGLAITQYLWDPVMGATGVMAAYGAYPSLWTKDEATGALVFGGVRHEVKEALAVLKGMYERGEIDSEFAFKDGLKVQQQIADGKIGMMYGEQWGSFFVQVSRDVNPAAEWRAFPIVSASDVEAKVPLKFSTNLFYAVRKDYSYPEAIVKLFNLHLEKNWGQTAEYETYYNTTQPVWQISPVTPFPAFKNLEAYRQIQEARRLGDQSVLQDEARFIRKKMDAYLNESHDKESGWGWEKTYGPTGAMSVLDRYEKNGLLLFDQYTGIPTETMLEKKAILDNLQHDAFINIILGNPLDDFDRFVEEWHKLGGEEMTAEVNQWYAERVNARD